MRVSECTTERGVRNNCFLEGDWSNRWRKRINLMGKASHLVGGKELIRWWKRVNSPSMTVAEENWIAPKFVLNANTDQKDFTTFL